MSNNIPYLAFKGDYSDDRPRHAHDTRLTPSTRRVERQSISSWTSRAPGRAHMLARLGLHM